VEVDGITASASAVEQQELRRQRALPRWRQRHRRQQQWRGHYQQSTINNQLKAAAAMAMETMTKMTNKM
jgi:hypothetical protein